MTINLKQDALMAMIREYGNVCESHGYCSKKSVEDNREYSLSVQLDRCLEKLNEYGDREHPLLARIETFIDANLVRQYGQYRYAMGSHTAANSDLEARRYKRAATKELKQIAAMIS